MQNEYTINVLKKRTHVPAAKGSISTESDIFALCASVRPTNSGTLPRACVIITACVVLCCDVLGVKIRVG